MPEERKAIHAYVTVPTHDVWHGQSEDHGVSLSGLLEVLAEDLPGILESNPDIVKRARRIDATRRRRGGGRAA